MSASCTQGSWTFHCSSAEEASLFSTDTHFELPLSPFWAERKRGVRIFRTAYGPTGGVWMRYKAEDFCIHFSTILTNTDNPAEMENLAKGPAVMEEDLNIFFEGSGTRVDRMTMDQFEDFIDDVSDTNLYRCLFECMPAEWYKADSVYRIWGTKLYRPIGTLQFTTPYAPALTVAAREGALRCFGFLKTMIDLQTWRPQSSSTGIYQRDIEDLMQGTAPRRWQQ